MWQQLFDHLYQCFAFMGCSYAPSWSTIILWQLSNGRKPLMRTIQANICSSDAVIELSKDLLCQEGYRVSSSDALLLQNKGARQLKPKPALPGVRMPHRPMQCCSTTKAFYESCIPCPNCCLACLCNALLFHRERWLRPPCPHPSLLCPEAFSHCSVLRAALCQDLLRRHMNAQHW